MAQKKKEKKRKVSPEKKKLFGALVAQMEQKIASERPKKKKI